MREWPPSEPPARLPAPGTVACWRIPIEFADGANAESLEALLDGPERERLHRFLMPADRRRFLAAHAALRILLGAALGCEPESLAFTTGSHGKPALREGTAHFNLSHSGRIALVAIATEAEVGADVEEVHSMPDRDAIAARYFHRSERAALDALDEPQREIAFFRTWTRKEAVLKALGVGIGHELSSFSVTEPPNAWSLLDIDPEPGHVGAIALALRALTPVCRTLDLRRGRA